MAGKGYKVTFHGTYTTKAAAQQKERSLGGGFIRAITIRGRRRYLVMTKRV